MSLLARPLYIVLDVSASMAPHLGSVERSLQGLMEELAADPLLKDVVRVALVTFADTAEIVVRLSKPDRILIPALKARGGTFYRSAIERLVESMLEDISMLKNEGWRVVRPTIVFATDGDPLDPDSLHEPWARLGKSYPNVIALALSDYVDPATMNRLASRPGLAFMAKDTQSDAGVAAALTGVLEAMRQTLVSSVVSSTAELSLPNPLGAVVVPFFGEEDDVPWP